MLMMFLRHLLIKVCSLWVFDLVVLHVSEPYSKTDLTLVLKILILLWRERAEEFQMGRKVLNACLALLIPLMSRNAHDDKNGRFGERAARLTILAKLAILAIFCQFRQISSSIGIDTTRVNIGDFGDFDKFGNFGDVLPISSN